VLGSGLPLVEHPAGLAKLKLQKHRVYEKTGTVMLDYEVLGPETTKGPKRGKRP
jgi:hypothetical protein